MKVGKLKVGDRVEVLTRDRLDAPTPRDSAWRPAEVTKVSEEVFSFRTTTSPHLHGVRPFALRDDKWRVSPDQREAQGYYGFDQGRVLLVGEAPNRWMEQNQKFGHCLVRQDLADLCGVGFPDPFVRLFARTNVLPRWPGRQGKGSAFPLAEARKEAPRIWLVALRRFDRVVCLGRRVERAMFGDKRDWFQWVGSPRVGVESASDLSNVSVAIAPHPSKLSHWWNEAANVREAEKFWRSLARFAALNAPNVRICAVCTDPARRSLSPRCDACRERENLPGKLS